MQTVVNIILIIISLILVGMAGILFSSGYPYHGLMLLTAVVAIIGATILFNME